MEAAGQSLVEKKKHFHSVTCGAHRLQNTIKRGLDVPGVSKLFGITRRLVTHFKHSVTAMDALRKHQEQTKERPPKFVQDVHTRWNSAVHILKRVICLHKHISAVLTDAAVTKKANQMLNLTHIQYDLAADLVSLLEPFEMTTTVWSAEDSNSIMGTTNGHGARKSSAGV